MTLLVQLKMLYYGSNHNKILASINLVTRVALEICWRDRERVAHICIDEGYVMSKVSSAHNVYPIEVKSNRKYSTTSLERFQTKFKRYVAAHIVLHPKDLATKNGIRYLPLYMAKMVCIGGG